MRDALYTALNLLIVGAGLIMVALFLASHIAAMLIGIARWRGTSVKLPRFISWLQFSSVNQSGVPLAEQRCGTERRSIERRAAPRPSPDRRRYRERRLSTASW
ncbi:MAG: hypothetical protein K0U93_09885 [Gammaproteobacteria bacterium]|nr:hypothetical protein [Gammaproteobacteria bacterium]